MQITLKGAFPVAALLLMACVRVASPPPEPEPTPTPTSSIEPAPAQPVEPVATGPTEEAAAPSATPLDPSMLRAELGVELSPAADGSLKASWPRDDVRVRIDGVRFPSAAGLTSWAAFMPTPEGAMVMSDTVVFQDEVGAVMDAAFAGGLEVTALHNHFFFDEPKVYFMHLSGHGDVVTLGRAIHGVRQAITQVRKARPAPATSFTGGAPAPGGKIDAAVIGQIIGAEPSANAGVVKVTLGRDANMHGVPFGASMGLTTWAAFTGSDELAIMDGDFAMTSQEVQPVLRALRRAGIHVVAIHNHMVGEQPAYYFTHFWGKGPAQELARAFRAALDAQREAGQRRPD